MTIYRRGKTRAVVLLTIVSGSLGTLAYAYYGNSLTMPKLQLPHTAIQQAVSDTFDKVVPTSTSSPIGEDTPNMLERSLKSIFEIDADLGKGKGLGTGFLIIVDNRRFIFTNAHVVKGAKSLTVKAMNGVQVSAKLLKSNEDKDVAVLETTDILPGLPVSDAKPRVGETVYALGNPAGYDGTVTQGIVSYVDRKLGNKDMIQHSAPTNPGNSGGPVLNSNGEIIGINSGTLAGKGRQERLAGMHVAIPIATALEELNGL